MPAVTVTDHGSMAGAVELYRNATKAGIKPIVGCEVYLVDDRFQKEARGERSWAHLTLLAEDTAGYHNLVKLVTTGYLEGYHYKPRVDFDLLQRYSGGLIALTGCLSGRVCKALLDGDQPRARAELDRLVQIFGRDQVYIEIQDAGIAAHRQVNPGLLAAGRRDRPADGRHRRRPLPARRGRRSARGAALHPDRRRAVEPEAVPVREQAVLLQDARGDGPRLRAVRPRADAAHARDRRALQRRDRARHDPAAAVRRAGRRGRLRVPHAAVRGRPGRALRHHHARAAQRACSSSCRPSARWASPTTS